uniref:KIB1-4 beta-propeller domain-containing protein n=1 Tax=Oryza punctata TaxID=4537 RepID=A0A0E0LMG9_ORYPU
MGYKLVAYGYYSRTINRRVASVSHETTRQLTLRAPADPVCRWAAAAAQFDGDAKNSHQSQATDAPRRAKRPRSLDAELCSCSGAGAVGQTQIHSPFAKRRGDHLLDCCSKRPRDWGNLAEGPAGLIAERLLATDVADYVRFRAVCGPWRRCCASPRARRGVDLVDDRFLPRRWIMINKSSPTAAARRHRFLNVATGECIHMDLAPELADYDLLTVTPEGLLVLSRKDGPHGVRLLNPLTRHLTELPPFATVLTPEQRNDRQQRVRGEDFRVSGVALADDSSTVVAYLKSPTTLAVAKPGDERWTKIAFD